MKLVVSPNEFLDKVCEMKQSAIGKEMYTDNKSVHFITNNWSKGSLLYYNCDDKEYIMNSLDLATAIKIIKQLYSVCCEYMKDPFQRSYCKNDGDFCIWCIEQAIHEQSCSDCSYGYNHGICTDTESDMRRIIKGVGTELRNSVDVKRISVLTFLLYDPVYRGKSVLVGKEVPI